MKFEYSAMCWMSGHFLETLPTGSLFVESCAIKTVWHCSPNSMLLQIPPERNAVRYKRTHKCETLINLNCYCGYREVIISVITVTIRHFHRLNTLWIIRNVQFIGHTMFIYNSWCNIIHKRIVESISNAYLTQWPY